MIDYAKISPGRSMNYTDPAFGDVATLRANLVRWAAKYGRANAEDLAHETLLRMFVHRDSFTPGTNAEAWATTIMQRIAYDAERADKVRRKHQISDFGEVTQNGMNPERETSVRQELRRCSAHQYWPTMLMTGLGYTDREIGEAKSLRKASVRCQMFRARADLNRASGVSFVA